MFAGILGPCPIHQCGGAQHGFEAVSLVQKGELRRKPVGCRLRCQLPTASRGACGAVPPSRLAFRLASRNLRAFPSASSTRIAVMKASCVVGDISSSTLDTLS